MSRVTFSRSGKPSRLFSFNWWLCFQMIPPCWKYYLHYRLSCVLWGCLHGLHFCVVYMFGPLGSSTRLSRTGFFLSKLFGRVHFLFKGVWLVFIGIFPVSILYKSIAGRYRPVRVADGPITARYGFIKNASRVVLEMSERNANGVVPDQTPGCAAFDKVPHCSHYVQTLFMGRSA